MNLRHESAADLETIRHVNRSAFGKDDEAHLVDSLRDGGYVRLSLVAEVNDRVVGHMLFSDLPINTTGGRISALALAPLAVLPEHQHRGIGSSLVRHGLDECREAGHRIVVALGHPYFYARFGFSSELAKSLESPFSGEAWMAMELMPRALTGISGSVQYSTPFLALG
jgi:putative acetyltransferase